MKTRITDLFGIQYPIIQGAMQWLSKPKLAAAVSNAGGLGTINMTTYDTPEAFQQDIFKGFSGATMTKLRYVDSFSSNETDNWAADYGADKGMVFFSDFTVGDATNTTLNPNSTYKDWQWYVIQTDAGDWSVVNQGQG